MRIYKKLVASMMIANIIAAPVIANAETYYKVDGQSMSPILNSGDLLKVTDKKYKNGDIVIGETTNGAKIVKKIDDNYLKGTSSKSISFDKEQVNIIGKAETVKEKSPDINANVLNVKALENKSPIKKVYTGWDFSLFLHEDTSITGFGRNMNNVLGMTGGETKNTSEWVQVSGPTGFEYLQATTYTAHGFRPELDRPGLYKMYRIQENIGQDDIGVPVRSAGWVEGDSSWHHHKGWVDENGDFKIMGDDVNTALGIGQNKPFGVHVDSTGRTYRIISPEPRKTLANDPSFTNNNDYEQKTVETNWFTVSDDDWEVLWTLQPKSGVDLDMTYIKMELINDKGQVVYSGPKENFFRSQNWIINPRAIPITKEFNSFQTNGTFKLRVTSKDTGWSFIIRDRKYLDKIKRYIPGYWEGKWMIVDGMDNAYIHLVGYGQVKKINFPAGVTIDADTITNNKGDYYLGLDKDGKLWSWKDTTPTLVSVPNKFYDNYKIVDMSAGHDHYLIITETKDGTHKRNVFIWGSNSYGQLGMEGTFGTPTLLKIKGEVINNVRAASAGRYFSVIVQDTDEGQLVYTFGKNDYGQLGGGINLKVNEPALVPGLSGINDIHASDNMLYAQDHKNQIVYSSGKTRSYMDVQSFGILGYPQKIQNSDAAPSLYIKVDGSVWGSSTGSCTSAGRNSGDSYAPLHIAPAGTKYGPGGTPISFDYLQEFGYSDIYFKNVKDANGADGVGHVIDSNGRMWSWGPRDRATGAGEFYEYDGRNQVWSQPCGLHPNKTNYNTYAPPIFEQVVLGRIYAKGNEGTDWGRKNGYALDKFGKIWLLLDYTTRTFQNTPIDNVVIKNIYGRYDSFYAVDEFGRLWSWFRNNYGQLGTGNTAYVATPVKIFDKEKVIHVSANKTHTLFVTESGKVYAMGDNQYGELGTGNFVNSSIPVQVKNLQDIVKVSAGDGFSAALDKQGRVWAWGYAAMGALGNNFSISRQTPSTAIGNELPNMKIDNEIQTTYLSKYGKTDFQLFGKIQEKDTENVKIESNVFGIKKQVDITSWERDIYDEVVTKNWELSWKVNEFQEGMNFQSLTKVVAEDSRGGIVEQFFAGRIIVDNEKPIAPTWGDTCLVDSKGVEACYQSDYFKINDTNSVSKPVRIYVKPTQKSGDNKAPVKVQIQYRIKQPYGYPPSWSDWVDVETSNSNGYYYEFFQGFFGETQIKMRSIDMAGNISNENGEYRYVSISNAGAEIDKMSVETRTVNKKLENEITFSAQTPTNSALKNYGIFRREHGEKSWENLTPERRLWGTDAEQVFIDNADGLLGNTTYEYKVNVENTVAIGKEKNIMVTTNPYEPINFIRKMSPDNLKFTFKQDERNKGDILYRLVLIDNRTGEVFSKDKKSNNVKEEVIFKIKEGEAPFSVLNNNMTVKLLIKGSNKQFLTIVYDDKLESKPSIISDKNVPNIFVSVEGNIDKVIFNGDNRINLNISATDDVTINSKLKVQFSSDGTNWYGVGTNGMWERNIWSNYQMMYKDFSLGKTAGTKVIYARVRDEAGNIGVANTKILVSDLVNRDSESKITDIDKNISSIDTMNNNTIHVKNSYVALKIPKTGNLKEVQFSFDGITWSEWEPLYNDSVKYITLPPIEGEHDIFVRYKNEFGDITELREENDVIRYTLDKEKPDLNIETANGTYIVKTTDILLSLMASDNLSKKIVLEMTENSYQMFVDGVKTNKLTLGNNTKKQVSIKGLVNGFNVISFKIKDEAGNAKTINVRIYKK
ncbi:hypothetical protein [Bacillus thuringiensis]|uniref:hypothetical protein n=1 Tax=Bacillus thuringiensis TaxID=1428 RepID=UPI0021D69BBC|nr:hypothetical protein [Bacillus thuringiensis]MCU7667092.1 hypothetical protein [Bacillus thuringiensis]